MNSYVQLISFVVSFFMGGLFYLLARFNRYLLNNKNIFFQLLITFIFVIDFVIMYVYVMFKINKGIIHPYFLIALFISFLLTNKFYSKIKKRCKIYVNFKKTLK